MSRLINDILQEFAEYADSPKALRKAEIELTKREDSGKKTLRDYFAAKAMAIILIDHIDCRAVNVTTIATESYEMSDAMLEARKL